MIEKNTAHPQASPTQRRPLLRPFDNYGMAAKVMMHKTTITRRPYPPNHGRGGGGKSETARRGRVCLFSAASHRRMDERLHSYDYERMIADGIHFVNATMTIRDIPDTPEECADAFDAAYAVGGYLDNLCKQAGIVYFGMLNWKREMTIFRGRHCPHWHNLIGSDKPIPKGLIWQAHMKAFGKWRPRRCGQCYSRVYDLVGLAGYFGKHTAKGVDNEQTAADSIPYKWRTPDGAPQKSIGRTWGDINKAFWHSYIVPAYKHDFTLKEYITARRRAVKRQVAQAKADIIARRQQVAAAKQCNNLRQYCSARRRENLALFALQRAEQILSHCREAIPDWIAPFEKGVADFKKVCSLHCSIALTIPRAQAFDVLIREAGERRELPNCPQIPSGLPS